VKKDEVVASLTSLTYSADEQKAVFPDCLEALSTLTRMEKTFLIKRDFGRELVALFKYAGFGHSSLKETCNWTFLWYDKNPEE